MNAGKSYEQFVKKLQKALIDSETLFKHKNIEIEQGKIIKDSCGIDREFDLYWEYEFAGVIYKTAIECKDYTSPIRVEKIDAFIGKLHDLPGIKPVFATSIGYQRGAKQKAEKNGIELLIVREQNEDDWYDKEGKPYIKEININIVLHSKIIVTAINPLLDKEWLLSNSKIKLENLQNTWIEPNTAKIEDHKFNTIKPIISYLEEIDQMNNEEYGEHEFKYVFDDAFLIINNDRFKIKQMIIKYRRHAPVTMPIKIDYSKEMIGVIEYLSRKEKIAIFNKGLK